MGKSCAGGTFFDFGRQGFETSMHTPITPELSRAGLTPANFCLSPQTCVPVGGFGGGRNPRSSSVVRLGHV